MLGSLFNKVAGLKVCNFFKNRFQHRFFQRMLQNLISYTTTLVASIVLLYNNSGGCFWQSYYGPLSSPTTVPQVSWGSLILCLHVQSILIKKFSCLVAQIFTITWQNNFMIAWIHWPCFFNFRICFGKTLIAFDFGEKLTQSIAQVIM